MVVYSLIFLILLIMKNLVVSGASKGIGRAIVEHFAKEGFNVSFCSRNSENLNALKERLQELYPKQVFLALVCDVSKPNEVRDFARKSLEEFGHIDLLVNNAGVFIPGSLSEMSSEDFKLIFDTNVQSAFELTKALVPSMIKQKAGYIFNMSSIAGLSAYPNGGAYNVSKHALTGYSKTLRNELKDYHIKVSTVYPGATLTDSWSGVDLPEERFMPAEDIAKIIFDIYQLSDRTVVEDIVLRPQLGDI